VVVTSTHLGDAERRTLREWVSAILAKDVISREQVVAAVDEAMGLAKVA